MTRPTIICLTPVKNEGWILDRFLKCASLWADHIVVADQGSTDGSPAIVERYSKAILVENPSTEFNEPERQRLLIEAARKIAGPRLLIALDADEVLSANVMTALEWRSAQATPPGTVIELPMVFLHETPTRYSYHSARDERRWWPIGYMDDGAPHEGDPMHSVRIPVPRGSTRLRLNEVVVLHYQFCDQERMASKHRWYRSLEHLMSPRASPLEIFRRYDWMNTQARPVRECPTQWLATYQAEGIDMTSIETSDSYWWDWEVLRAFAVHGVEDFRSLDIWAVDWEQLRRYGMESGITGLPPDPIEAPQRRRQKFAMRLVRRLPSRWQRWLVDPIAHLLLKH